MATPARATGETSAGSFDDVIGAAENRGEWQPANGELAVRSVRVETGSVLAVSARRRCPCRRQFQRFVRDGRLDHTHRGSRE